MDTLAGFPPSLNSRFPFNELTLNATGRLCRPYTEPLSAVKERVSGQRDAAERDSAADGASESSPLRVRALRSAGRLAAPAAGAKGRNPQPGVPPSCDSLFPLDELTLNATERFALLHRATECSKERVSGSVFAKQGSVRQIERSICRRTPLSCIPLTRHPFPYALGAMK